MKKLTIEHLAPYLGYGLQIQDVAAYSAGIEACTFYLTPDNLTDVLLDGDKPVLRPLSDLTKEIDVNGERFVPMVRLLEMKERNAFSTNKSLASFSANVKVQPISCESKTYRERSVDHQVKYLVRTSNMGDLVYSFTYSEEFNRFAMRDETYNRPLGVGYQLQLFQKLFEWHFDVFGLIEKGLAIDINTIQS